LALVGRVNATGRSYCITSPVSASTAAPDCPRESWPSPTGQASPACAVSEASLTASNQNASIAGTRMRPSRDARALRAGRPAPTRGRWLSTPRQSVTSPRKLGRGHRRWRGLPHPPLAWLPAGHPGAAPCLNCSHWPACCSSSSPFDVHSGHPSDNRPIYPWC
jgi:hypothetical protein